MAYGWTQFSATVGQKITAGSLATALSQANAMNNNFAAGFTSVNSGRNSAYNGATNNDWCNSFGCYTHFSGFGSGKCGAEANLFPHFLDRILVQRGHK